MARNLALERQRHIFNLKDREGRRLTSGRAFRALHGLLVKDRDERQRERKGNGLETASLFFGCLESSRFLFSSPRGRISLTLVDFFSKTLPSSTKKLCSKEGRVLANGPSFETIEKKSGKSMSLALAKGNTNRPLKIAF